jgi:predicted PurR-regulated permease PerM
MHALLTLQVAVVAVAALYFAREVLIPVTIAVLLSFLLAPLANLLRGMLGRVASALVTVAVVVLIVLALSGLIGMQVADLISDMPRYQYTLERKASALRELTLGRLEAVTTSLAREEKQAAQPSAPSGTNSPGGKTVPAGKAAASAHNAEAQPIPVEVHQPPSSPMEVAERLLAPAVNPLATAAIVFIVTVFVLLQREDLRDRLIRLFGSGDLHRTTVAMDDAARRLSRYFLAQLGLNTGFGLVIGTGLYFLGIPSPVVWGTMATVLAFIPYVGTPLAALLPLVLAASVDPGWSTLLKTAALYLVAGPMANQVLEPLLYGRSTGLSPASVVVAATFWTWLWGPIGLILSTPLTLCLVVLGRHVKRLEFLDVMLGDRPALSPVESFYQRMLAGDPDEAGDQAELLLKKMPLSSYYDEVAMKGLQFAVQDVRRGVLAPERLDRMRRSVETMVQDLDEHEDVQPPEPSEDDAVAPPLATRDPPKAPPPQGDLPPAPELPAAWRSPQAVLCVAGRGRFDESVAAMLAQLLGKHGIGARVVPHDQVARDRVTALDLDGVAMICLCYVEIAGSPAQLRYLLRRLHQRLSEQKVLVGIWPADDPMLSDARARASLGIDHATGSLRQSVEACLTEARAAAAAADERNAQPAEALDARAEAS